MLKEATHSDDLLEMSFVDLEDRLDDEVIMDKVDLNPKEEESKLFVFK